MRSVLKQPSFLTQIISFALFFRPTWTKHYLLPTSFYEHWWHQCVSLPLFVSMTNTQHDVCTCPSISTMSPAAAQILDWRKSLLLSVSCVLNKIMLSLLISGDNSYRVDAQQIKTRASLLHKYLCDEQKELQALYALQALMVHMEQPASECPVVHLPVRGRDCKRTVLPTTPPLNHAFVVLSANNGKYFL